MKNKITIGKMKFFGVSLLIAFCLASGCAEHRVIVKGYSLPNDTEVEASSTYWGYGWCEKKKPWESDWASAKSSTRTLAYVSVRQKYWQSLISTFSFGAFMPVTLEWRLNPVITKDGLDDDAETTGD